MLVLVLVRGGRPEPPDGVRVFDELARTHTTDSVSYDVVPPVGGPHNPLPQTCGFYDEPVQSEFAVHSLEHGAVWVTFRSGVSRRQLEILRNLASDEVLISSWPGGLPAPVVVSAWGRQLRLQAATDPRLERFIEAFRNGPNAPEPQARCVGIGQPEI